MKNILFPKSFSIIGWLIFIPALVAGSLSYFNILIISGLLETIVNDAIIIGIALGAIFIVCSKEPQEDEMIRAIRLSSLLNALYAYVLILITGTIVINGVDYQKFIMLNLVLLPIILVFIFKAEMQRYYKENEVEEQN